MQRKTQKAAIEAMTLGNMRQLGVRSLAVTCIACHHESAVPVDAYAGVILVYAFGPRMVRTRCRIIGAGARLNWLEYRASGMRR